MHSPLLSIPRLFAIGTRLVKRRAKSIRLFNAEEIEAILSWAPSFSWTWPYGLMYGLIVIPNIL